MRFWLRAFLPAIAIAAAAAAAPAPASAGASTGSWRECRPHCGPGYYRHRVNPQRYGYRNDWGRREYHRRDWRAQQRRHRDYRW